MGRRLLCVAAAVAVAPLPCGCQSLRDKQQEATYAPTESVIEIVAVVRRHVPDDTYRFPPGMDFSGRNVYRSSLLRLENLERLHRGALSAGHLDEVIAFSKARAFERLRAYSLAVEHFERATSSPILSEAALVGMRINAAIAKAVAVGPDLRDPLAPGAEMPMDTERVVSELDERVALLTELAYNDPKPPYPYILREEVERADVTRASYFTALRRVIPDGNLRAVGEWQRVNRLHAPSKNRFQHTIALANLYATLAHEYVVAKPPESLDFDPPTFRELVDSATRLYEIVAHQDGTPEKLEAARELEAFLAFTLQVDNERFTQ